MTQVATSRGRPRRSPKINGPLNTEILERMRQLDIRTWQEFADHFDIGRSTLHNVMTGRQSDTTDKWISPSPTTLNRLAVALNLPAHEIYYRLFPNAPGADTFTPSTVIRVPVIGRVGTGPNDEEPLETPEVTVSRKDADGRDLIAYEVRGHSMSAGRRPIFDGDIVIVDAKQINPASGHAVVARLNDDSLVLKAFKSDKFGSRLQSTNAMATNGTPPYIPLENVAEICGVVVQVVGKVDTLGDF
ncbi:MAG: hypothetical protein HC933_21650 [Pleurocapsa sp. SU_196_0]|nr:hypothetical protein [Pleurocapsa sp. SU_196_0]